MNNFRLQKLKETMNNYRLHINCHTQLHKNPIFEFEPYLEVIILNLKIVI